MIKDLQAEFEIKKQLEDNQNQETDSAARVTVDFAINATGFFC